MNMPQTDNTMYDMSLHCTTGSSLTSLTVISQIMGSKQEIDGIMLEMPTEMVQEEPMRPRSKAGGFPQNSGILSSSQIAWNHMRPFLKHVVRIYLYSFIIVAFAAVVLAVIVQIPLAVEIDGKHYTPRLVGFLFWRLLYQFLILSIAHFTIFITCGKWYERTCRYKCFLPFLLLMYGFLAFSTFTPVGDGSVYSKFQGKIIVLAVLTIYFFGNGVAMRTAVRKKERETLDRGDEVVKTFNPLIFYSIPVFLGMLFFYGFWLIILPAHQSGSTLMRYILRIIVFPIYMETLLLTGRFLFSKIPSMEYQGASFFFNLPHLSMCGRFLMISDSSLSTTMIMAVCVSVAEIGLRTTRIRREALLLKALVRILPKSLTYVRESARKYKNKRKSVSNQGEYIENFGYIRAEMANIEMITEVFGTVFASLLLPFFVEGITCYDLKVKLDGISVTISVVVQLVLEFLVDLYCVYREEKHYIPILKSARRRRAVYYVYELSCILLAVVSGLLVFNVCDILT